MVDLLISIIIPTYNRAQLIGETLDSVLEQTYRNWECIVVDDGSSDDTAEVLQNYMDKDYRFQYHSRPEDRPKGANACRNYGFELSKGQYINWLDSDDLLKENKLEVQILSLVIEGQNTLATCEWWSFEKIMADSFRVDCKSAYLSYDRITNFLEALGQTHGFFPPHLYLMHRSLIESAGKWREDLYINQDGEFMSRIFALKPKIKFCNTTSIYYRVPQTENTSVISSREKVIQLIMSWKLIRKNLHSIGVLASSMYFKTNFKYLKLNVSRSFPDLVSSIPYEFNTKEAQGLKNKILSVLGFKT